MSDFSELTEFSRTLQVAAERVPRNVRDEIRDGGERIAERAAEIADKRTGYMAESIRSDMYGNGDLSRADIGPTAFYGGYVEHGTAKMTAKPFLGPAADLETPGIAERIAQAGVDGIAK